MRYYLGYCTDHNPPIICLPCFAYLLYKLKLETERKFFGSSKTCHVRFPLPRKFHIYFTLSLTHARRLIPPLHLISLLSSPPYLPIIKVIGLSTLFTTLMPEIQFFLFFSLSHLLISPLTPTFSLFPLSSPPLTPLILSLSSILIVPYHA